jgi:hypothetical protein
VIFSGVKQEAFSLLLWFGVGHLQSQVPDTDLWLFRIEKDKAGKHFATKPINITARPGYDNQPFFSDDGKSIYYSSIRDDGQSDIYYYDIHKKKTSPFAHTAESEYSPQVSPDGSEIACVTVEKDSTQRIHLLDVRTGAVKRIWKEDSIGYFLYLNQDTIIYYKLGKPNSLRYASLCGREKWICENPLRSFRSMNRHCVLYATRDSSGCVFYKYDFNLKRAENYARCGPEADTFTWHPQLGLLRPEGTKIMSYNTTSGNWDVLFELSASGIKHIGRIEIDPKAKHLVAVTPD